jgi:hypothetical protein
METIRKRLEGNKITQEFKDFIKLSAAESNEIDVLTTLMNEVEVRDNSRLYRGFKQDFKQSNWAEIMIDLFSFRMVEEWSTSYRKIYINNDLQAMFTYCEDELGLIVFDDN